MNYLRKFKHRELQRAMNEGEKGRKRVSVLLQLFCNSAQMSSSALKERRNSLGERITIIRMFIKTQTNSMRPSCRLTRTVLSLPPFFFSFSLLRYTHRIGRIPCKRLRVTLVEPTSVLLLSPGHSP